MPSRSNHGPDCRGAGHAATVDLSLHAGECLAGDLPVTLKTAVEIFDHEQYVGDCACQRSGDERVNRETIDRKQIH